MNHSIQPVGVHLVGSIPYDNTQQVFKNVAAKLGKHICRIPDGETGERINWIDWQLDILKQNPNLELVSNDAYSYTQVNMVSVREGCDSKDLQLQALGYSDAAINSYGQFKTLKSSGEIPQHCRFQVCLPTPLATTHIYVTPSLQEDFASQYETRLLQELNEILDVIPNDELAIQWDTAVEFALLEGVMPTYLQNLEEDIAEILLRLAGAVPESVELGFHLCYGDSAHKHFCEPKDTSKLVMVANNIAKGINRELDWIHLPVPKDRSDEDYFKPIKNLNLPDDTQLFLGLVHYSDGIDGTIKRIDTAKKFIHEFGVATECGFGRRSQETLEKLMQIHTAVSSPVV